MIDFASELNVEQLDVVLHGDGPCLVLAGAGSGKTRTITYRVAYLLEQGVASDRILLVTFTNKAAKEMTTRVEEIVHRNPSPSSPSFIKGRGVLAWSGTYHHIAYRLLKKYAGLLGYKNNFTILDSADSLDLLKLCLKSEGIERKQKRFPSPNVIQSLISYARNAETTIADVLDLKHPNWSELAETLGRIAELYRQKKLEANAMDFDDLLVNLYLLLLKAPNVKERLSEQFQYILVDEYQDTNKVQASIIRLLASKHRNVLVVGDDAQSIYSFRAADIANILDYEKTYPDAKTFRLETNYRSTPDILNLANDVIANNRDQYEKQLKSIRDVFTKPEVHAFSDQQEEAEFVATRILELREEGVPLHHMAVLFRASFHSQALEVELVKRDIPYDYRGGVRFFERSHIKDVLAYLRIIANNDDVVAWSRVLNMQTGIGSTTVEKIIGLVRSIPSVGSVDNEPLPSPPLRGEGGDDSVVASFQKIGVSLSARAQIGWADFLQVYELLVESDGTPSGLIKAILKSKYTQYLEYEHENYRERVQDIEQLALFSEHATDVSTFLAEASMQESYTRTKGNDTGDDEPSLVLSTIHQAKGLEWTAVFVLNLSAGQFPNERATKEHKGIEEERRLFYVAITRAKKYLHLTYPLTGGYTMTLGGPSMFLEELDRSLISESGMFSGLGGGSSTVFDDPSDDVDDIVYEAIDDDKPVRSFLKGLDEL